MSTRGHRPSTSSLSSSPPWQLEEVDTDDIVPELSIDDDDLTIEVDQTFLKDSAFPGTVKIVVQNTTFWAHKEVLFFSSPFFEAALSGNWAETNAASGRPQSMSSIITISQTPTDPGDKTAPTEMTFAPIPDVETEDSDSPKDEMQPAELETEADQSGTSGSAQTSESEDSDCEAVKVTKEDAKAQAIDESLAKLESKALRVPPARAKIKRRVKSGPDAVIVLKEERATTFHDFLKFIYPHLECTITWNNAESLMNISHKLCVPSLQQECLKFLLTHAAGRPIKAMRIAEIFGEEELYREASRFVLDNPGGWTEQELNTLSRDTLLKLEKRRNWFLERVLKLGLTILSKEYQCCATCPDPANCARQLEEKWRQGYHSIFRIGPPQPSMVFRYMRTLEGISPPLSLTHLSCQTTAKAFVATLFDRMFSLGVRGSGTEAAPLNARGAAAMAAAGPRRHFLYCSLKPETQPQTKRSRELISGTGSLQL
ncbi:hypothetical protein MKEN_00647800 [Mycena kentingensis (nom. inval.)]|nr:hypothetical protein MKEN_00647800 [Mycena kentingensis (nom. inval.)]